jgi:hypothetical protein
MLAARGILKIVACYHHERKRAGMSEKSLTIDELETPAVIVDLDVLEANIARMSDYARRHALRLRPHTKTHKVPAIAQMQIASGSHGITVAKSGEAEVMASAGLDNILLAYPIFGEKKLGRLANLALEKKITIAIDGAVTAEAISQAAHSAGSTINMLVELDVGMRRWLPPKRLRDWRRPSTSFQAYDSRGLIFILGISGLLPQSRWRPCVKSRQNLPRCSKNFRGADSNARS